MAIWDTTDEEFTLLQTQKLPSSSTISCVMQPHAYVDKILIGTVEGHLDLYNIRAGELVHRFPAFPKSKDISDEVISKMILRNTDEEETQYASVTTLCDSPSLDVVAIGLSDGQIILHNIRYDKALFQLVHSPGPITALTFRTDNVPSLASGNGKGEIAIWDLESRSLLQLLSHAHSEAVMTLLFVPEEGILMSSGADNTLQKFIMDRPDKLRLEIKKEGHSKPPQHVKFYDPMGNWLISTGLDRQVRLTSLLDKFTSEVSQTLGKQRKKNQNKDFKTDEQLRLSPVTGLDINYMRQDDWENMITCHDDSNVAYLWFVKERKISKKHLYSPEKLFGNVTAVATSVCGNIAVVAGTRGRVAKWYLQSGELRNFFERMPDQPAHHETVNAVAVDNTNAKVVTGGYDSVLRIWDLATCKLLHQFELGASITKIVKSKVSNLIAVSTDDYTISIYDLNTDVLIRQYKKHEHQINDMTFSHDSRLLISCCRGSSIIVYDIVTARVIDWLKVPKMAVSLDFHPEGLYLASCHADTIGISLWLNKLIFGNAVIQSVGAPMNVNLPMTSQEAQKITTEEEELEEYTRAQELSDKLKRKREVMEHVDDLQVHDSSSDSSDSDESSDEDSETNNLLDEDFGKKAKHGDHASRIQNSHLVTFTGIPKTKWYSIMHLDELRLKQKNQNAAESIGDIFTPFSLSTLPSLTGKMNFVKNSDEPRSRILGDIYSRKIESELNKEDDEQQQVFNYSSSDFIAMVKEGKNDGYISLSSKLKDISPKDIDLAIRLLSVADDAQEFKDLLDFLLVLLKKHQHFDVVQAVLNLFLQVHSEFISKSTDLTLFDKIDQILQVQATTWDPLDSSMQNTLCLSKFIQGLY
jgi:U3 small nucleolar RNA-associated protein 21